LSLFRLNSHAGRAHTKEFNFELQNMQQQIDEAMLAEQHEGFGFQYQPESQLVVFARLALTGESEKFTKTTFQDVLQSDLKTLSDTSVVVNFLGRYFVKVHISEWEKIPQLFDYINERYPVAIRPHCLLKHAVFKPGEPFSWRAMEIKTIAALRERMCAEGDDSIKEIANWSNYCKHWNWRTEEGKSFCSMLQTCFHGRPFIDYKGCPYESESFDEVCRAKKILHRGSWSRYEPSSASVDDKFYGE